MDAQERHLRERVKEELRRRIRAVRGALPAEARAQRSARVAERVLSLPEVADARCVAGFVPIRSEVDPTAILDALADAGARVCLPRVDAERGAIVLHERVADMPLQPSPFGVPEPPASAPEVAPADVDVVLVPGLAFDPRGYRVGYGKGYYDRLLATMPQALSVAIGFDFQLVPEVPDLPHDVPVRVVVTDARVLRVNSKAE